MARKLVLVLSLEQIRAVHEVAVERSRLVNGNDEALKRRWETIARVTSKVLDFAVQTSAGASASAVADPAKLR